MAHTNSSAFRVTSSLMLSVAYFATAIGVWGIVNHQISADSVPTGASCVAPYQASETFEGFSNGTSLASAHSDWTANNSGGTATAIAQNSLLPAIDPMTNLYLGAGTAQSISIPIRTTKTGDVSFDWTVEAVSSTTKAFSQAVSLVGPNGTLFSIRYYSNAGTGAYGSAPAHGYQYLDEASGQYVDFSPSMPTNYSHVPLHWDGSAFTAFGGTPISYTSPSTIGAVNRLVFSFSGTTQPSILAPLGVGIDNIDYPAGTGTPCIQNIQTPVTLGSYSAVSGMNFANGDAVTLTGGASPIALTLANHDGNDGTFVVPSTASTGTYNVTVTNSLGTSNIASLVVNAASSTTTPITTPTTAPTNTLTNSTGLVCSSNDTGKDATETFDSFTDGQTSGFGWNTDIWPSTSATVKTTAGKTGNGLELADTNSAAGYQAYAGVTHAIRSSTTGSVSVDVKPSVTTGRFTMILNSAKGNAVYAYLSPSDTYEVWDNATTSTTSAAGTQDPKYIRVGTTQYGVGSWINLKLEWDSNAKTFNVYADGTKLNAAALPFSYVENAGAITSVEFETGWESATGSGFTGTYDLDNVVYPGCSDGSLALSVSPTSGTAPLATVSTVTLPTTNVLNKASTELNDVGAASGSHLTYTRDSSTGALNFTGAPTASTLDASNGKCWLYDLDQNKINQLQWKQTLPDKAVVDSNISWDASDPVGGTRGTMELGGIGLIDGSGNLLDWAGFTDGNGTMGQYGSLAVAVPDGTKSTLTCNVSPANAEFTVANPTDGTALTDTTGSSHIQIVKNGQDVKLYVDGKMVKEHTITGTIAGVAVAVSGFPTYSFNRFNVTSLQTTDGTLGMDFSDGTKTTCTVGATTSCDNSVTATGGGITPSLVHTFAAAGEYNVTAANAGQTATQKVTVTAGGTFTAQSSNSGSGATSAAAKLISSGGSLWVNLGIAFLFSIVTTFALLRRKTVPVQTA